MAFVTAERFTRADLAAMPDDGRRYELLDGSIVMTPSPGLRHQIVVANLLALVKAVTPEGLHTLVAPLDVYLPTDDVLQPDVLVITPEAAVDDKVQGAVPLLAVEVLAPSTGRRDVGDKLTAYRDAGVPSYWVVDPVDPRLRAWRLDEGEYVEIADVSGEEEWTAELPFRVTVRPIDLTR